MNRTGLTRATNSRDAVTVFLSIRFQTWFIEGLISVRRKIWRKSFTALTLAVFLSGAPFLWAVPKDTAPSTAEPTSTTTPKWTIELVTSDVQNASSLCVDDAGHIYVTETFRWTFGVADNRNHSYWIMDDLACDTVADRSAVYQKWKAKFEDEQFFTRYSDRVVRLTDHDGDGKADVKQVFADGFNQDVDGPAIGLLYGNDTIYMACVPDVWMLRDTDGDGVADERESLQSGFGVKTSLSGHDLHGLTWGPDGKLYFSMGDRGFHCQTRDGRTLKDVNSGAVFRCNPDGSELEIFYHQLRNPQEIAFNEYGDLFTVDNNCDQGDSARICYLLEGGTSGWHLGAQALTTYSSSIDDGGIGQSPHWLAEGVWKLRHAQQPAHILPPIAHLTNGPSGMTFHSGVGFGSRYQNHFLVCDYKGAPNLCFLYSFRVQPIDASYSVHDEHIVHAGIPMTDVEVSHDGRLLVTDFGGGWHRTDRGNVFAMFDDKHRGEPSVGHLQQLFRDGFNQRHPEELLLLLAHRDMRVRLRAQYALSRHESDLDGQLASMIREVSPAALHAIWTLGQRRSVDRINPLLSHELAEIRAQAARTLGNIGVTEQTDLVSLRSRLNDSHARVRTFASIALGKLGDRLAVDKLLSMVERNADRDAFERHAAVFALSHLLAPNELAQLHTSASRSVRLAALLALRRQRAPAVAVFVRDTDPMVAAEAIRAINDEGINAFHKLSDYAASIAARSAPIPPDEMVYRRVLNGCLRSGRVEDARVLLRLASTEALPNTYRSLALQYLTIFDSPPPIDPTLGVYRPLPSRDIEETRQAIEMELRALFAKSSGDLAATAISVMDHFDLRLDDAELMRRILDGRQPEAVRLVGLRQLFANQRYDQQVLLKSLLVDASPELRSAAANYYVQSFPDDALTALNSLLEQEADTDYRTVFEILSESNKPELVELLCQQLDDMISGDLYRTVQLDLYEAAQRSSHSKVIAKIATVDEWLASTNRPVEDLAREGGDAGRGAIIFQNQGLCLKCHSGQSGGGNAGPVLTNIGRLRRTDELLQSLLDPNADVVPGYGTVTIYLDDGRTLNGTPLEDTGSHLRIKTVTGETQRVARDEIEEMTDVTSPMPNPMKVLSRQELRDLIAYLTSLK